MKITVNVAMTLDGKIDNFARRGATISSDEDWARVDRLRADHDAIVVGGKTLLEEDPRLLVKSPALRAERVKRGLPADPVKVGIVSAAKLPANSRFLRAGSGKVILFTTKQTPDEMLSRLREAGAYLFVLGEERVDLRAAMARLAELGIEKVMVEGGGTLIAALLTEGLVDEIHAYIAPRIFGGATAPTLADGEGMLDGVVLQLLDVETLEDGGVLVKYSVVNSV